MEDACPIHHALSHQEVEAHVKIGLFPKALNTWPTGHWTADLGCFPLAHVR